MLDIISHVANAHRNEKIRAEDMVQREFENQRRLIEDTRRQLDKKMEQLKGISEVSALLTGKQVLLKHVCYIPY